MIPVTDLQGVKLRSVLRPVYFDDVEGQTPGFTAESIATVTSNIYARLRKRYAVPFGQAPAPLLSFGVTPPGVTLSGTPSLGSYLVVIQITTGGALGTAVFQWSQDGGTTWQGSGITTAPLVLLGNTGITAAFPGDSAAYDTSNSYAADTPVPRAILRWVTILVTEDVATRHGVNTNDPLWDRIVKPADKARAEIEEAANSQVGLFDLPLNEDSPSAIVTGGPFGFSDSSPYAWTDRQACLGRAQDACGSGGGSPCPFPPNSSWVPP
jgi:hypothetical protein